MTYRVLMSPMAAFTMAVFVPIVLHGQRPRGVYGNAPVEVITRGVPLPAARVERLARGAVHGMERRLGMSLEDHDLTVQVCGGDREYRDAGGLGNTDACYLAPSRIILRGSDGLQADLAHEFAHVLIGERTREQCPAWLEEGVINHENHALPTGQYSPATSAHLTGAIKRLARSGRRWSLDGLGNSSQRNRNMTDAFYGASWSATDYLYRTYGRAAVLHTLSRMSDTSVEEAFTDTFGRTPGQVEADWKATLR